RGQQLARSGGNMNPRALAMWMIVLRRQPWTHLVDVGANYGEMLVNGGLPAGARIVAIEPSPDIRLHLERTLADAGIQAEIIDAAVSDSARSARPIRGQHKVSTTP